MKKAVSLALLILLSLGLVVSGCGGGEETTATTTSPAGGQTTTTSQPATTASSSSSGDLNWDDMPVYSGADSIQEASWSIPPSEGDYAAVEWRYYETGDSMDDVADFYDSEMPDNGWDEMANVNMPQMKYFVYNKNNENDAAMIWVSEQDGKTVFALMRATK